MSRLPRKWVFMDEKGRLTIPKYLREAMEIPMDAKNFPLLVEAVPDLENCKGLIIKKG